VSRKGLLLKVRTIENADFFWLAGILEGEGSFMKGPPTKPKNPRITMASTDEDVLARVAKLFDSPYCMVTVRPEYKQKYQTAINGKRAVDLMLLLRPFMSIRRQQQIDIAIACWEPNCSRNREYYKDREVVIRYSE
jgi:hypothetical protein